MKASIESILRIRKLREQNVRSRLNRAREEYQAQLRVHAKLVESLHAHRASERLELSDGALDLETFLYRVRLCKEHEVEGHRLIEAIGKQEQHQRKMLDQQGKIEGDLTDAVRRRRKLEKASEKQAAAAQRQAAHEEDEENDEQAMQKALQRLKQPDSV